MYEIKEINVWTSARYVGILAIIISLVPALIIFVEEMSYYTSDEVWFAVPYLLAPLAVGIFAYLGTALVLWLYNLTNEHIGGIKVDLEFIPEKGNKEKE
ncbi:hypothetical protein ACFL2M_02530 [Patescibacteria group bacterium]